MSEAFANTTRIHFTWKHESHKFTYQVISDMIFLSSPIASRPQLRRNPKQKKIPDIVIDIASHAKGVPPCDLDQ
jgi:hypothetical protein